MIYIYNNIGTFTKYHINIDSIGFQALLLFSWDLFSFEHLLGYKAHHFTGLYFIAIHVYGCITIVILQLENV